MDWKVQGDRPVERLEYGGYSKCDFNHFTFLHKSPCSHHFCLAVTYPFVVQYAFRAHLSVFFEVIECNCLWVGRSCTKCPCFLRFVIMHLCYTSHDCVHELVIDTYVSLTLLSLSVFRAISARLQAHLTLFQLSTDGSTSAICLSRWLQEARSAWSCNMHVM